LVADQDVRVLRRRPGSGSHRGFFIVLGCLIVGCILLMVEIFANRPMVSGIARSQRDLRAADSYAIRLQSQSGTFESADAKGLTAVDPGRSYLSADAVAADPGQVSVYAGVTEWAAATPVNGACFYILERDGKTTLYGGGTDCTGRSALAASQDAW
jgi:hypothetical protein